MSDFFDDSPFGNMFNEDVTDTTPGVVKPTQFGQLPVIPASKRAESGFVGLTNQFVSHGFFHLLSHLSELRQRCNLLP